MKSAWCCLIVLVVCLSISASAKHTRRSFTSLSSSAEQSDALAALKSSYTQCEKGKPLTAEEVVKKFVSTDLIAIATLEKKVVEIEIGKYTSKLVTSVCTNGNCGPYGPTDYRYGSEGIVILTVNPSKLSEVTISFKYNWPSCESTKYCMNHLSCPNYTPKGACDKDTRQAGGDGMYVSFRTDVPKQNSFIMTDSCLLNVREYYATSSSEVKKYFQVIQGTFNPTAFADAPKPIDTELDAFVRDNSKCAKGKALSASDLLKQFVNKNMIDTANREGKTVEVVIAKYKDNGVQRTCLKGVCTTFKPFNYLWGGEGIVRLIYSPSNPDNVDLILKYYWPSCQYGEKECMTHLECKNYAPGKPCAERSMQTVSDPRSPGDGTYFSPAAVKNNMNSIIVTKSCFQIDFDYYYMTSGTVTTAPQLAQMKRAMIGDLDSTKFVTATSGSDSATYYNTAKEAGDIYAKVIKEKILSKDEIVKKFFTPDNIEMASLQGAPAKKVISMYQSSHIYKSCKNGICESWKDNGGLAGKGIFGGDGLIALDYDTRSKKLSIRLLMNGTYGYENQQHFMCEDIGDKVTKCSVPPRVYMLQGSGNSYDTRTFWTNTNLIQGSDIEANELYITKSRILHVYKYFNKQDKVFLYGEASSNNLLITYSANLDDFANPDKGNCLSKAKVDDIMASKDAFLKRYVIVLQRGPVTELVQKAPYKDVESAVQAIKGIGFKNVLYISRKYDFTC